jgi:hypothetical protein
MLQLRGASSLRELSPAGAAAAARAAYLIMARAPRHAAALSDPAIAGAAISLLAPAYAADLQAWCALRG